MNKMVKQLIKGTTIEIWSKDYINKEDWMCIDPKDEDVEILQIEHAYDDYFIVEIRRKNK